jgi:hypothetical protein
MPLPDDWLPFLLGAIVFLIPIVAILTSHQQKMAKILREGNGQTESQELAALRAEVAKLTQAVHQNTLAIDSLASRNALPPAGPTLVEGEASQVRNGA